jgi:putative oxidoreductase
MNKYLSTLGRVFLALLFIGQIGVLIYAINNGLATYDSYQAQISQHTLFGMHLIALFAPLNILIQMIGGVFLLVGFKTRTTALFMAAYTFVMFVLVALGSSPLSGLAIVGGLLALATNPTSSFSLDNLKKET